MDEVLVTLHKWERYAIRFLCTLGLIGLVFLGYKWGYSVATDDILTYLRNKKPAAEEF